MDFPDRSNLIIGNSSQLSHYFPKSGNDFISSRNINFDEIKRMRYKRIFILFAEQRTFLNESEDFFIDVNVRYTLNVIDQLKNFCDNIIVYSTSELWNKHEGCISIEDPYNYFETPYIKSKEILCNTINQNREKYKNVIIIYPFNFNSPYRKDGFLFKKIFDSLIYGEKITVGNVDFKRDLIHPKIIVDLSLETDRDIIVGSGELYNVRDFIGDLFQKLDKKMDNYVTQDISNNLLNKRNHYYSCSKKSSYEELINLTIKDIHEYKFS
jgi:nucleoside-diphosphate-sugar epimerase